LLRKSPGLCFAGAVAGYIALWLLIPRATFLPIIAKVIDGLLPFAHGVQTGCLWVAGIMVGGAPTVAFMAVQIAIVYFFARFEMSWRRCAVVLVASLAGVVGMVALVVWQSGVAAKMGRYPSFRETLYLMGACPSPLKMPMSLLIILAASSIGYLVSLRVRDRNLLLPVVMFAAWVDFWTVTRGPVSDVLKNAPEVAMAVAAPIPAAGTGAFVPATVVGPGDFLFMALVFAAVHRLGLNGARNYWFVFAGMTLGMLAVLFGLVGFLPALVVLAVAVVAANWGRFRLTRQEATSMAIVGVVMIALLPVIWSILKPPEHSKPLYHGSTEGRKH